MEMNYDTCVTWLKPTPQTPYTNAQLQANCYELPKTATGTKWQQQLATGSWQLVTGKSNMAI